MSSSKGITPDETGAAPEVAQSHRENVAAIVKEVLNRPADSVSTWVQTLAGWLMDKEESLQTLVVAELVNLYEDSLYRVGHAALQAGITKGQAAATAPDPAPAPQE